MESLVYVLGPFVILAVMYVAYRVLCVGLDDYANARIQAKFDDHRAWLNDRGLRLIKFKRRNHDLEWRIHAYSVLSAATMGIKPRIFYRMLLSARHDETQVFRLINACRAAAKRDSNVRNGWQILSDRTPEAKALLRIHRAEYASAVIVVRYAEQVKDMEDFVQRLGIEAVVLTEARAAAGWHTDENKVMLVVAHCVGNHMAKQLGGRVRGHSAIVHIPTHGKP